jgi:hypothetical protein
MQIIIRTTGHRLKFCNIMGSDNYFLLEGLLNDIPFTNTNNTY